MSTSKLTPSKPTTPSTADVSPNTSSSTDDKRLRKIARLNQEIDTNLILSDSDGGRRGRRRMSSADAGGGAGGGVGGTVESEKERRERKRIERGLAREVGDTMLAGLMEVKDNGGHLVYTPFFKLPNKRQFPDYYSIIKHPLSIEQIRTRLDLTPSPTSSGPAQEDGYEGYEDLGQVKHDFDTVFGNAKRYNAPGSQIYTDAQMLHKIVKSIYTSQTTDAAEMKEFTPASGGEIPPPKVVTTSVTVPEPKIEPEEDDEDDEDGADGVTDDPSHPNKRRRLSSSAPASDGQGQTPGGGRRGPRGPYRKHGPSTYKMTKSGMLVLDRMRNPENTRRIADIFDQLPDKNEYPDYYSMIPNPISLAEISIKVQKRAYATIESWAEDVSLMCTNAMTYNVEGSTVYNDAVQMKKELWARLVPELRSKYHADDSADPSTPSRDQPPQHNASVSSPYPVVGLPPLPRDTITPEIVAQLYRYPESIKTAWTRTLSAVNNARLSMLLKQNAPPPPPPAIPLTPLTGYAAPSPLASPYPSSHPPLQSPAMTSAYHPVRPSLSVPLVRYVSFAYDDPNPAELRTRRKLLKLRNMPGVKMHTVSIGARTHTVEIVAYLEEGFYDMQTSSNGTRHTVASSVAQSPLPEISLRINGREIPGMLVYPDDNYDKRPSGCRWEVPIPIEQTGQNVIDIFTRKRQENVPGGRPDTSETTQLYVHRQG